MAYKCRILWRVEEACYLKVLRINEIKEIHKTKIQMFRSVTLRVVAARSISRTVASSTANQKKFTPSLPQYHASKFGAFANLQTTMMQNSLFRQFSGDANQGSQNNNAADAKQQQQQQQQTTTNTGNNNSNNNESTQQQQQKEGGEQTAEQKELAKLKAECDELRKALQYSLAERENVRKIAQRDVKDAKEYGVRDFAKNLLDVSDNFDRALSAVKPAAEAANASAELRTFYEGVQMTETQLHRILEKFGVTKYDALGAKFNPNEHSALTEIDSDEHPEGHVALVLKKGFRIKDRILRVADVGVSRKK